MKDRILIGLAILALGLYLLWRQEILILFLIAALNAAIRFTPEFKLKKFFWAGFVLMLFQPVQKIWAQVTEQKQVLTEELFFYFAKVGSVLFGSGYVLFAFLQSDLTEKYQWITQQQLVDAVAVGQFTPGPVFTTATFIGYLISGHLGAVVATVGIFAPAFVFVALSAPFIPKLRQWKWTAPLLDGLNVASLALMAGAAFILGSSTVNSVYGILVFLLSLALLLKNRINSTWLILISGILGYLGLAS